MNHLLSNRINSLSESQTLAMTKKARELQQQGFDVINLSIGEPDFNVPEHIKKAAKKAIDENFSHYSPVSGYQDLRVAIAEKLRNENKLDWKAENIVVSTGAKQSLANAILCLINPGDEVIIFSPYWVSYAEIVKLAEGKIVIVEGKLENGFKVKPQQLEKAITSKTKAIMYSSPSNPTGAIYSERELRAFGKILEKNPNIFIIADEIYEHNRYVKNYFSLGSISELKDNVITVNGFSKGFAMTGWRVGYTASVKWLADAMDKIQGQITSGTNAVAQRASLFALQNTLKPTQKMKNAYKRRRDLMVAKMKEIKGFELKHIPEGAFYLFPEISYFFGKKDGANVIRTGEDFCIYLLNEAKVSLVTGEAFGEPRCIRISYAAADELIEKAMERIKVACEKLK